MRGGPLTERSAIRSLTVISFSQLLSLKFSLKYFSAHQSKREIVIISGFSYFPLTTGHYKIRNFTLYNCGRSLHRINKITQLIYSNEIFFLVCTTNWNIIEFAEIDSIAVRWYKYPFIDFCLTHIRYSSDVKHEINDFFSIELTCKEIMMYYNNNVIHHNHTCLTRRKTTHRGLYWLLIVLVLPNSSLFSNFSAFVFVFFFILITSL